MKKFLIDECVLYLKSAEYQQAFKDQEWHLIAVGDFESISYGSSDDNLYE